MVRIKRIEVKNFKSFKDLKVDLGKFNLIIGANASGKSNFVSIFKFLKDIATLGLDNAISLQGGIEYLRNMSIGASEPLSVKIVCESEQPPTVPRFFRTDADLININVYETIYEFALGFNGKGSEFMIIKDELRQKCRFSRLKSLREKSEEIKILGDGEIVISRRGEKIKVGLNLPEKVPLKKEHILPLFLQEGKLSEHELLMETKYFSIPVIGKISIYDFDPKLSKEAVPITGKAELEEDGSNLSIILKNILENKESRRKLFNLVKNILPFVEDLDIEKFPDTSLLFKLKESYFRAQYLPASFISDGTINTIALIIALYFEKKPFIIIEEPERNIHPSLISRVVEMMKDASKTQKKQIIVTTHNPEFVKYAGLENILLISRDKDGFSRISRPADKAEIKTFLKNNIGIEELYLQNLLEV